MQESSLSSLYDIGGSKPFYNCAKELNTMSSAGPKGGLRGFELHSGYMCLMLELSKNQVFSCRGSSIKEMFRKLYNQSPSSALSKR